MAVPTFMPHLEENKKYETILDMSVKTFERTRNAVTFYLNKDLKS